MSLSKRYMWGYPHGTCELFTVDKKIRGWRKIKGVPVYQHAANNKLPYILSTTSILSRGYVLER